MLSAWRPLSRRLLSTGPLYAIYGLYVEAATLAHKFQSAQVCINSFGATWYGLDTYDPNLYQAGLVSDSARGLRKGSWPRLSLGRDRDSALLTSMDLLLSLYSQNDLLPVHPEENAPKDY